MTQSATSDSADLQAGVEVWRGGVNTWECDEMGHLNVRHYVSRSMEGLIGLAAELGMPHAFSPEASATLRVREQHVRFLREARPPNPMHMIGGVIAMGETDAELLLTLVHTATGAPAASFRTVVSHVTPRDGRAFPWPRAVRARAQHLQTPLPAYAAARSVTLGPVKAAASLARADTLGLTTTAVGALRPRDCDVFGQMAVEGLIARISDGVGRVVDELRGAVMDNHASPPPRIGAAALEYRLVHLDAPRPGDRLVVRSGLVGVDHHAVRVAHWMLDPGGGAVWGLAEAVIAAFDLDLRRIILISAAAQTALKQKLIPDAAI